LIRIKTVELSSEKSKLFVIDVLTEQLSAWCQATMMMVLKIEDGPWTVEQVFAASDTVVVIVEDVIVLLQFMPLLIIFLLKSY
jgi:hypothetical protein